LVAAYLIAVVATPAGISGAVLLLPFQVSVLAPAALASTFLVIAIGACYLSSGLG